MSLLAYLAVGACLCGCRTGFLSVQKKARQELPPGIVLPREKIEKWRELVNSAKDSGSAATATARLQEAFQGEDDPQLRAELVRLAGSLPPEAAWPIVELGLRDENPDVQVQACRMVAKAKMAQAVGSLAKLAEESSNQDVRQAAIKALGQFKDPVAIQALAKALRDRDPAIQYLAIHSLRTVTGQDFGYDVAQWLAFLEGRQNPPQPTRAMATRPTQRR
ncbi:MAG TPA: HEAT repeat domain-containing protein [Thermogutta sp.]|nr:HEAT repeat domain-containing protein [Thermogutta sp.]HOP77947.1 HEAT repeat domain-containing protein [Thermogutta sp.]HPU06460.1 HEAT repeat domain-containing protein [Thermogutta sp.]HPZ81930.1 HEAT repeat domain-containing protein [Thermogutta sp.]HQF13466.1 HEAT repeat domain-containing protein [Thermogutta sp.]